MTDRELDALVGKTFGDRVCQETCVTKDEWHKTYPDDDFSFSSGSASWGPGHVHHFDGAMSIGATRYSRDIADAWRVVEEMRRRIPDYPFHLTWLPISANWAANFRTGGPPEVGRVFDVSAPRAICLAALRALGVEVLP